MGAILGAPLQRIRALSISQLMVENWAAVGVGLLNAFGGCCRESIAKICLIRNPIRAVIPRNGNPRDCG